MKKYNVIRIHIIHQDEYNPVIIEAKNELDAEEICENMFDEDKLEINNEADFESISYIIAEVD
jgi:hypothetical protein